MSRTYKIGELAEEFGITLRTLRFYEDKGLIAPERMGSTRIYSELDRDRLRSILFCKRVGMSLAEIRQVVSHRHKEDDDAVDSDMLRLLFEQKLVELEKQRIATTAAIADLQHTLETLGRA